MKCALLLKWHVDWAATSGTLSQPSATWLYALTARLERPLTQVWALHGFEVCMIIWFLGCSCPCFPHLAAAAALRSVGLRDLIHSLPLRVRGQEACTEEAAC